MKVLCCQESNEISIAITLYSILYILKQHQARSYAYVNGRVSRIWISSLPFSEQSLHTTAIHHFQVSAKNNRLIHSSKQEK